MYDAHINTMYKSRANVLGDESLKEADFASKWVQVGRGRVGTELSSPWFTQNIY